MTRIPASVRSDQTRYRRSLKAPLAGSTSMIGIIDRCSLGWGRAVLVVAQGLLPEERLPARVRPPDPERPLLVGRLGQHAIRHDERAVGEHHAPAGDHSLSGALGDQAGGRIECLGPVA